MFSISALLVTKESLGEIRDQAVGVRIATSAEWLAGAKLGLVLRRINQVEHTLNLDYEAVLRDGAAQLCKQGYLLQDVAGDFSCTPSFFDLLTELGLSTLKPKTQE